MRTDATGREIYKFLEETQVEAANDGRTRVFADHRPCLALDVRYLLDELGNVEAGTPEEDTFTGAFNGWVAATIFADPRRKSPRYPYTYAHDLVRDIGPRDDSVEPKLSRADAGQILQLYAKALEMPEHELAEKLADYYLVNEQEILDRGVAHVRALHAARDGG